MLKVEGPALISLPPTPGCKHTNAMCRRKAGGCRNLSAIDSLTQSAWNAFLPLEELTHAAEFLVAAIQ